MCHVGAKHFFAIYSSFHSLQLILYSRYSEHLDLFSSLCVEHTICPCLQPMHRRQI